MNEGYVEGYVRRIDIQNNTCYGEILCGNKPYSFVAYDENVKKLNSSYLKKTIIGVNYKLTQLQNKKLKKLLFVKDEWVSINNNWELYIKITNVKEII